MTTRKKYHYLYLTPPAVERFSAKFVQEGEKKRGVRGGVIYAVRKFPVLYHAGLDEALSRLGVDSLLKVVARLAADEEARLLRSEAQMTLRPHGAFALAAGQALGIAPLAALSPFARVCLEVNALAVIAKDGRWPLQRVKPEGKERLREFALEAKDFDLAFYQGTFGEANLVSALSLVGESFWIWFDQELATVRATPEGATHLQRLERGVMEDSPLPAGDYAGEALAHRIAVVAAAGADARARAAGADLVRWFEALPAFARAALELHLWTPLPMKDLAGVNALLLPSTADFFRRYFGTPATGAAFACETFRALFEAELATGFVRDTFSDQELALLRRLLGETGLPKGEGVGLHLLSLLKREIDLNAACDRRTLDGYEALIAKIAPLSPLRRLALSVFLLAP